MCVTKNPLTLVATCDMYMYHNWVIFEVLNFCVLPKIELCGIIFSRMTHMDTERCGVAIISQHLFHDKHKKGENLENLVPQQ